MNTIILLILASSCASSISVHEDGKLSDAGTKGTTASGNKTQSLLKHQTSTHPQKFEYILVRKTPEPPARKFIKNLLWKLKDHQNAKSIYRYQPHAKKIHPQTKFPETLRLKVPSPKPIAVTKHQKVKIPLQEYVVKVPKIYPVYIDEVKGNYKHHKEHKEYSNTHKDHKEHKEYSNTHQDYKEHKKYSNTHKDHTEHKEYSNTQQDYEEHKEYSNTHNDHKEHKEYSNTYEVNEHEDWNSKEDENQHRSSSTKAGDDYKLLKSKFSGLDYKNNFHNNVRPKEIHEEGDKHFHGKTNAEESFNFEKLIDATKSPPLENYSKDYHHSNLKAEKSTWDDYHKKLLQNNEELLKTLKEHEKWIKPTSTYINNEENYFDPSEKHEGETAKSNVNKLKWNSNDVGLDYKKSTSNLPDGYTHEAIVETKDSSNNFHHPSDQKSHDFTFLDYKKRLKGNQGNNKEDKFKWDFNDDGLDYKSSSSNIPDGHTPKTLFETKDSSNNFHHLSDQKSHGFTFLDYKKSLNGNQGNHEEDKFKWNSNDDGFDYRKSSSNLPGGHTQEAFVETKDSSNNFQHQGDLTFLDYKQSLNDNHAAISDSNIKQVRFGWTSNDPGLFRNHDLEKGNPIIHKFKRSKPDSSEHEPELSNNHKLRDLVDFGNHDLDKGNPIFHKFKRSKPGSSEHEESAWLSQKIPDDDHKTNLESKNPNDYNSDILQDYKPNSHVGKGSDLNFGNQNPDDYLLNVQHVSDPYLEQGSELSTRDSKVLKHYKLNSQRGKDLGFNEGNNYDGYDSHITPDYSNLGKYSVIEDKHPDDYNFDAPKHYTSSSYRDISKGNKKPDDHHFTPDFNTGKGASIRSKNPEDYHQYYTSNSYPGKESDLAIGGKNSDDYNLNHVKHHRFAHSYKKEKHREASDYHQNHASNSYPGKEINLYNPEAFVETKDSSSNFHHSSDQKSHDFTFLDYKKGLKGKQGNLEENKFKGNSNDDGLDYWKSSLNLPDDHSPEDFVEIKDSSKNFHNPIDQKSHEFTFLDYKKGIKGNQGNHKENKFKWISNDDGLDYWKSSLNLPDDHTSEAFDNLKRPKYSGFAHNHKKEKHREASDYHQYHTTNSYPRKESAIGGKNPIDYNLKLSGFAHNFKDKNRPKQNFWVKGWSSSTPEPKFENYNFVDNSDDVIMLKTKEENVPYPRINPANFVLPDIQLENPYLGKTGNIDLLQSPYESTPKRQDTSYQQNNSSTVKGNVETNSKNQSWENYYKHLETSAMQNNHTSMQTPGWNSAEHKTFFENYYKGLFSGEEQKIGNGFTKHQQFPETKNTAIQQDFNNHNFALGNSYANINQPNTLDVDYSKWLLGNNAVEANTIKATFGFSSSSLNNNHILTSSPNILHDSGLGSKPLIDYSKLARNNVVEGANHLLNSGLHLNQPIDYSLLSGNNVFGGGKNEALASVSSPQGFDNNILGLNSNKPQNSALHQNQPIDFSRWLSGNNGNTASTGLSFPGLEVPQNIFASNSINLQNSFANLNNPITLNADYSQLLPGNNAVEINRNEASNVAVQNLGTNQYANYFQWPQSLHLDNM